MTSLKTKYDIGDEVLVGDVVVSAWESERKLTDSILKNINEFMKTSFNEEVKLATGHKHAIKKAVKLKTGQLLPIRGMRLDIWVECVSGKNYIIEVKNPAKANYETFKAIGQVLGYAIQFPEATNLVIVSTSYDDGFLEIVEKYRLPIDFVLITETQTFLLKR